MCLSCTDSSVSEINFLSWEVKVPLAEIDSVFIIPSDRVKSGEERLVVLNRIARAVIERQRGKHPNSSLLIEANLLTTC